jgi:hypothetical protein
MEFKVGDRVWLATTHLRLQEAANASRKLQPRYHGPYEITQVISPVAYRLNLPPHYKAHPVVHISHLKEYADGASSFPDRPAYAAPPPPIVMNDGNMEEKYFQIEEFVNHRLNRRRRLDDQAQFLVKWQGYGTPHNSWESVSALRQDMMADIYAKAVQHYLERSGAELDKRWFSPEEVST